MPVLRPDSIFSEFAFTTQELIAAKTLTFAQICFLQTMFASYTKEKASTPIPSSVDLDRDYICKLAELDGKLNLIQELIDNHNAAIKELSDPNLEPSEAPGTRSSELDTLAARASNLVNKTQE